MKESLDKIARWGFLPLRVFAGLVMAFGHGWPKLVGGKADKIADKVATWGWPLPDLFAWSAVLSEFAGGLLLAVGLGVRFVSPFVAVTMLVAAFVVHGDDPFGKKELAFLYFFIFLSFGLRGAGELSVDSWLAKRPRRAD